MAAIDNALDSLLSFCALRLVTANQLMDAILDIEDLTPIAARGEIEDVRKVLAQIEHAFRLVDTGSHMGWPDPPEGPPPA